MPEKISDPNLTEIAIIFAHKKCDLWNLIRDMIYASANFCLRSKGKYDTKWIKLQINTTSMVLRVCFQHFNMRVFR